MFNRSVALHSLLDHHHFAEEAILENIIYVVLIILMKGEEPFD